MICPLVQLRQEPAAGCGHGDAREAALDATSGVYSGLFVAQEGTWTSLRGVRETLEKRGVFGSLYTDGGSHYWHTPAAGRKADKSDPTQFRRAMAELGFDMIPAYSPEGRGRSERFFGTVPGRLPQELALEGSRPWRRGTAIWRTRSGRT